MVKLQTSKPTLVGRWMAWKWIIWAVVIILLVAIIAVVGISVYVGWSLTHPARKTVTTTPASVQLRYDNIQFMSRTKDVQLKGWFLPSATDKKDRTLIIAAGYAQNRLEQQVPALSLAKSLINNGYNVVMFDFRDNGESGGTETTVGQLEEQDLLGAVDWVKQHHPSKVGLIGFSMGATTSLLATADDPSIVGVIADSPFNNLLSYLKDNLPVWSHLPNFPFTPLILDIIPPLTGMHPEEVNALSAVDRIYPRPVLFIHSNTDTDIPYTNSETMWKKHKDKFQFWETTGVGHVGSYAKYKAMYTAKVESFFGMLM
ncbi:alpha/beta hydrolase [Bacillus xiapuensis]|uniref:Alpha/beta fold hydrolase n=1 Tax=Bacillus xiapuensis TaxID=2014075 RepID=A0ABU6NDQ6_9BACI|nr:alpha/beta fold hydrolase [Bacillus xiapuensis]